jgi:transposase
MWVNLSMPRPDLSRLTPAEKDALILALLDRVAALEAKLGEPPKTPNNSSLPPSRGRKTNRPPRPKRPRRKRMGPGVTRARAATPDRTVACYAERCRHCGVSLDGAGQTLRQAYDHIDLPPVRPVVTRVQIFGRRCPCCRRRVRGVAPADMPPGSPFGVSVQAMLAYLHHHHAIAYDRLCRLMAELFGLKISEGAIANALRRAAKPLAQAGEMIAATLREAQVVGCDETGARLSTDALGTRMAWEWVLVSDRAVLHQIHPSRGRDVIDALMAGHRPRCWVADRWAAQQDRAETHQLCLAHVLRDAQYAINAGEAAFAPALRRLLCWAIAVGRRRADLKDTTLAQYRATAERRLDRLIVMPVTTKAGAELMRQTKRWRSQFFTFMTDRQVPPTNNGAERALRPSVVFRKVTNGFRSLWGADVHALTRSVIGTARLNGIAAHQAIKNALSGTVSFKT